LFSSGAARSLCDAPHPFDHGPPTLAAAHMTAIRPPNRRVSIAALPLRWRVATFLAFAAALNYADRAAMSAVLSAVRTDLGVSDVSLGLLGSVFLWSYAVGSPIAGSLADRYS